MLCFLTILAVLAGPVEPMPEAGSSASTEESGGDIPSVGVDVGEEAESPAVVDEAPVEPRAFEHALSRAKVLYFEGRRDEALGAFLELRRRLDAGEEPAEEALSEAMLYLGEIQFERGDANDAWSTFEWLLRRNPEQSINPYHHPKEVVHWFELVKVGLEDEEAPPPVPSVEEHRKPRRLPLWGYAPFGVPQFVQGRPAVGAVFASLQISAGVASAITYAHLVAINKGPAAMEDESSIGPRVQRIRYLAQWPVTVSFYALWLGSTLDASIAWKNQQRLAIAVRPEPGGAIVEVHGSF